LSTAGKSIPLPDLRALKTLGRATRHYALHADRHPESPWVFPHKSGPNAGEPVQDIKNGFHAALEAADIEDFKTCDIPSRRG